nr:MAG TPA: hypothetical protein [Caudoviricetes sp.]
MNKYLLLFFRYSVNISTNIYSIILQNNTNK